MLVITKLSNCDSQACVWFFLAQHNWLDLSFFFMMSFTTPSTAAGSSTETASKFLSCLGAWDQPGQACPPSGAWVPVSPLQGAVQPSTLVSCRWGRPDVPGTPRDPLMEHLGPCVHIWFQEGRLGRISFSGSWFGATRKVPTNRFGITQIVYIVDRIPLKISVPTLPRGGSNA